MMRLALVVIVILSGAFSIPAFALQATQNAAPAQPAPADVPAGKLRATVTGVEGLVQVRNSADAPWQKRTVGKALDEQAEFRTGPKSAVRFTIPPDQTVTLDRLGTVKILQAVNDSGKL